MEHIPYVLYYVYYYKQISRDFSVCLNPLCTFRCMNRGEQFAQQFVKKSFLCKARTAAKLNGNKAGTSCFH